MAYIDEKALTTLIKSLKGKMSNLVYVKDKEVTTRKIADGAVTLGKLEPGVSSMIPYSIDIQKLTVSIVETIGNMERDAGPTRINLYQGSHFVGTLIGTGSDKDQSIPSCILFTSWTIEKNGDTWDWSMNSPKEQATMYVYNNIDKDFFEYLDGANIVDRSIGFMKVDEDDINNGEFVPGYIDRRLPTSYRWQEFTYSVAANLAAPVIDKDDSSIVYITDGNKKLCGIFIGSGTDNASNKRGILITNCTLTKNDTAKRWNWTASGVTHIYVYKEESNSFTDIITSSTVATLQTTIQSLTSRIAALEKKVNA